MGHRGGEWRMVQSEYLDIIVKRYGPRTKKKAVELALRHLSGQPMSRDEALAMRGAHAIEEHPSDPASRGGV